MTEQIECPEELLPVQNAKEGDGNDTLEHSDTRGTEDGGGGETLEPLCETAGPASAGGGETAPLAQEGGSLPLEVLEVSDPAGTASDPSTGESTARDLLELREELKEIKAQLASRDAARRRAEGEYEEFRALYPGIPLSSLPDSVWEDIQSGVPLAAAFALAERRRTLLEESARAQNRENKKRAPSGLEGTETPYFSPAEVRAMTPEEVRNQYDKIIASMQKWN